MDCGVGTGVYSDDLKISRSFRLPNLASIFHAEVLDIEKACEVLLANHQRIQKAIIYTDSQAALLALSTPFTNSSVVQNCKKALSTLKDKVQLDLVWVPGHRNIFGNEKADELAKAGAVLDESEAMPIPCPQSKESSTYNSNN
ncbi:ribonuclease H1-like [Zeugodacus cucurbitae]|uniref:ribonuclease H1-like n=1 Tax=Zeugodacus cucurbitae TaxID=28588 RepID=UPI0023D90BEE|nr:ribonuclease H1-like [Zeugodacus cucurbitae]